VSATTRRPEALLAGRGGAVELLRLPAYLMGALSSVRNRLYDRGWLRTQRLQLPVVSVGNLSVGGTGKTPMVVWLARALAARGFRPGILSRGYRAGRGAEGATLNDEGRLLASLLPDVPQVQRADRVRGALELERRGADLIVLDDGFQHRRLARDLDLCLIDSTRPWGLPAASGGGAPVRAVLPRGLLREDPRWLARASALVLTRVEDLPAGALARLEAELEATVPGVARLCAQHRPVALRAGERRLDLAELRGRPVQLVSGIGNPEAFERTARGLGADLRGVHAFPDHHEFTRAELQPLCGAGELLVTAKDAVKLAALDLPHLVLEVELEITRGLAVLEALLDALPVSQRTLEREAAHSGLHG
jgi:tetraacyldisaccharide 4'-kinase